VVDRAVYDFSVVVDNRPKLREFTFDPSPLRFQMLWKVALLYGMKRHERATQSIANVTFADRERVHSGR
jgi:hypothetical protein